MSEQQKEVITSAGRVRVVTAGEACVAISPAAVGEDDDRGDVAHTVLLRQMWVLERRSRFGKSCRRPRSKQ